MSEVIASGLILVGALLSLIAAVGLFRLPDVFGRMHAATKPAVLGLILLLVGVAVLLSDLGSTTRLLVAAGMQLVTAPVAMHVVGRAVERVVDVRREDVGDEDVVVQDAGPA
jgi:multicomponent Na+:H+ antiporter subunit G